jgi:hypothetical protein
MCGGGGGQAAPDPQAQADADIRAMQAQYEQDERQRLTMAGEAATKDTADRAQWDTDLNASRNRTRNSMDALFEQQGLDAGDYDSRINAALDTQQAGMAYGGNSKFGTDTGNNILGDIRNSQIKEYQRGINDYAQEGFENKAFGGTSDDSIIDSIIGEQFGTASDSILRAQSRGTLNDEGFRYAMDNLNTQKAAANSRLQNTGGGILEGYRGQLGDLAGNARTAAGNYDFGDTFDNENWKTQLSDRQTDLSGRLDGDIRNAIGGEQFFDTASLIQKGGVGQGAQNTGLGAQSGSLVNAIGKQKEDQEQSRGLGSSGSF